MPLQATSGAASYDAFGGGVPVVPAYIEDIFSCFLYTGTGSAQTITNNIDISGKGALVWGKARGGVEGGYGHFLQDTARGTGQSLMSNNTDGNSAVSNYITSFNSNGFTLGTNGTVNNSGSTYVSWTFRKQPKFFDVVTFTKSSSPQTISHNLGSTPGCIFIKRTDSTGAWLVAHRGYTGGITAGYTLLNTTDTFTSDANAVTAADSTSFTLGSSVVSGDFVAYLFAHDAGGFGLTGTDNVISCGSFTGSASGTTVNLGWEPQWVLIKRSSGNTDNWRIYDNMRGMTASNGGQLLYADTSGSETTNSRISVNATGFGFVDDAAYGNIYIAIRRGPMKVPTSGTSVFDVDLAGNASAPSFTSAFPVDLGFIFRRSGDDSWYWVDRLRGTPSLSSNNTDEEASFPTLGKFDYMNGYGSSTSLTNYTGWNFRRAPSFFDVCCYTGNGATQNITHNLGVAPELMVVKKRSVGGTSNWAVYASPLANADAYLFLNDTAAVATSSVLWNSTAPTSTVFSLGASTNINQSGQTAVAYLFATCAGVSKVGSYTGNGTTQTINCGFTGGARFVLIKKSSGTGDWMVSDSARGIVSGNDPYLELNNTNAEVTGEDWLDTDSTGFVVNEVSGSNANTNGATYIFLAIA